MAFFKGLFGEEERLDIRRIRYKIEAKIDTRKYIPEIYSARGPEVVEEEIRKSLAEEAELNKELQAKLEELNETSTVSVEESSSPVSNDGTIPNPLSFGFGFKGGHTFLLAFLVFHTTIYTLSWIDSFDPRRRRRYYD